MGRASKLFVKFSRVVRRLAPARWHASTPHPILAEALGRWSSAASDIHDHLGTIFGEAVAARPRLIVELGTRDGISTRALLAAADVCDADVVSIDIADCSAVTLPERLRRRWTFIRANDVDFAGEPFAAFCASRGIPPYAEVIYVDTSHLYEHTRSEIAMWVPRLSPHGTMLFHDTNMGNGWHRRLNGKAEPGWNNQRGVIRALEEFLGRRYDESTYFADVGAGFVVRHVPWSSGFTILRRLDAPNSMDNSRVGEASARPL